MTMRSMPPKNTLLGKAQNMPANAATKQIGDKVFYQNLEMWIDRRCRANTGMIRLGKYRRMGPSTNQS